MACFFSSLRFKLFGSENAVFNPNASLHKNFINMCTLSVFRKPSPETVKLEAILKVCELDYLANNNNQKNINLTPQQKLDKKIKDVAVLEFAINMVQSWQKARQHVSTRTVQMKNFLDNLIRQKMSKWGEIQNEFKILAHAFHQNKNRAGVQSQDYSPASALPCLNYPSFNLKTFNFEAQLGHLDIAERKVIQTFANELHASAQKNASEEIKTGYRPSMFIAFLMPFVNMGLDFDCFNCMLDSLSTCLNLAKVF